jgi:hypothetical protein
LSISEHHVEPFQLGFERWACRTRIRISTPLPTEAAAHLDTLTLIILSLGTLMSIIIISLFFRNSRMFRLSRKDLQF